MNPLQYYLMLFYNRGQPVVKISFRVVSHFFSDSMNLVIHEMPPVGTKWMNFETLTCPDCWKSLSETPSEIYFKHFIHFLFVFNIVETFSVSLRCSFLQQELKYLCLQCSWKLAWNNWIGHMLAFVIMQLTWTHWLRIYCSNISLAV